ncbi:MAG TPA: prepilin-type N-terminal cleavage/methylation domain-containing protein [Candidatus Saccharimonadales bacterium]
MTKQDGRGFTVVELLIVIVVVAILSAVVTVAYSGIARNADNNARITAAKDWYKIFHTYLTLNGQYPNETLDRHFCLAYGYATNLDINADEDCFMKSNVKHPSTIPLTALKTTASFPSYPKGWLTNASGTDIYVGISMRSHDALVVSPTDGTVLQAKYRTLQYWLDGANKDCVIRPIAVAGPTTGTWAESTNTYTSSDGKVTRCVVLLPDPAV